MTVVRSPQRVALQLRAQYHRIRHVPIQQDVIAIRISRDLFPKLRLQTAAPAMISPAFGWRFSTSPIASIYSTRSYSGSPGIRVCRALRD